jgi:translation elongation factor EF-1beta
MTETSRTTDTVEIGFGCSGEIKVDDDVDSLDVDTASEKVGADEVAGHAVAEIVKDPVSVGLKHLCVGVETRVAELGDLFGEELDSVGRVAENDGLVDLELRHDQRLFRVSQY